MQKTTSMKTRFPLKGEKLLKCFFTRLEQISVPGTSSAKGGAFNDAQNTQTANSMEFAGLNK